MTVTATTDPAMSFGDSPFVGLRPFDVRDRRWFFGRESETTALARSIRSHSFTAVIGASGCGKSSLVRAGVLPQLAVAGWGYIVTTPGAEPIARLARCLSATAAGGDVDPLAEARLYRFDTTLRASAFGLADIVHSLLPEVGRLILVVDQFEELFRYGEEACGSKAAAMREEARAFVELLLNAATSGERLRVVSTMRSDFFGNCTAYAGLAEAVSRSQFLVPMPLRDQLEQAIRRPVAEAGAMIAEGLVQRLLVDVEEEADKLSLLQHTLRWLWDRASGLPRHLDEKSYAVIGKLAGSINVRGEEIIERLEADSQGLIIIEALEIVMKALTELDSHNRVTRRPQKRSALIDLIAEYNSKLNTNIKLTQAALSASLDRVLAALQAEGTCFVKLEAGDIDPSVDIGHEALIRSWRRLSGEAGDFKSGWLWEEAQDALNYRYLRHLVISPDSGKLSGPPISWWGRVNPKRSWAKRYGGDFDRVSAAVYEAAPELKPRSETVEAKTGPEPQILERGLGIEGPRSFRWWKTGLDRAVAVASVRQQLGSRTGTGFLVRAGDFGLDPGDELLVLTNSCVVNEHGAGYGIPPAAAEIVFEAVASNQPYLVERILWTSPPDRHDASLLRLKTPVTGIEPLPLAAALPILEDTPRVYIIGHAGGRDLAFSFLDNELIDHEGPPGGKPQIPGVCRVHYRTPTQGGSSGSPVFNESWRVIAIHHKSGREGMPRLNGKEGTYGAREGISILSIRDAIMVDHGQLPP